MSGRHLRWGLVAAALYLSAGLIPASTGVPVLPVFDGLAPPDPYRWVSPPPDALEGVGEPLPGEETIPVEDNFGVFTVITDDGQAQATMLADAVELPAGEEAIAMTITPLDPETVAPPPSGRRFDSNAYRIEAEYLPSGDPVVITDEATVLLRYAIHAEEILRREGNGWQPLETTILQGTLQAVTNTGELGVFVTAGPDLEGSGPGPALWIGLGAGAAALLIGAGVFLLARRRSAPRGRRPSPREAKRKGRGARGAKRR